MATIDTTRKRSQRMAYETYVALYRRSMRTALGDPARTALVEATRRAEARWRALMVPASDRVVEPRTAAAPTSVAADAMSTGRAEAIVPLTSARSFAAWGE